MEKSITFYSNLLGLQMLRRYPAGPGIERAFMGNNTENETIVELLTDTNNKEANFSEFISIGFAVNSIDSMFNSFIKNNSNIFGIYEDTNQRNPQHERLKHNY